MMIRSTLLLSVALFATACTAQDKSPCTDATVPAVGSTAATFTANDVNGKLVDLDALRKQGPVVLFFYRGSWCPICNKHLAAVQDSLQLILDKGATVVAITPETPESAAGIIEKSGASFPIVHDAGYKILCDYGTAFRESGAKVGAMKVAGYNIPKANGNDENVLTVPATFIIGQDGTIIASHYDTNYKDRMSVKEILAALP
ncbi:MAG: peroxiredoxin-like family protein [Flavobacteriales bacterium]